MNGPPASRPQVVTDPRVAAALVNPALTRYLGPFIGHERTVTEAAGLLRASLNATYRAVRRLEALGLLRVTASTPRPGRAVKRYAAAPGGYFVPFSATPAETVEALFAATDRHHQARLERATPAARAGREALATWGLRLYRTPQGLLVQDLAPHPDAPPDPPGPPGPPEHATWTTLRLTRERAAALAEDLDALWRRYLEGSDPGHPERYLLRLALAPIPDDA